MMDLDPKKEPDFIKATLNNPRFRKHIMQRLICFGVIFVMWVYINGGKRTRIRFLKKEVATGTGPYP